MESMFPWMEVVLSHFKLKLIYFSLLFFLIACDHQDTSYPTCNYQGFPNLQGKSLSPSGIQMLTIPLSAGSHLFELKGSFKKGKSTYDYQFYFQENPKKGDEIQPIKIVLPELLFGNQNNWKASTKFKENCFEITLLDSKKRIYLKDVLISER